ncbi:MAG: hypothetical protein M3O46_19955 [Myxococcota bacterium]|nr:hypothetical protein [Myxococcota bacterium]
MGFPFLIAAREREPVPSIVNQSAGDNAGPIARHVDAPDARFEHVARTTRDRPRPRDRPFGPTARERNPREMHPQGPSRDHFPRAFYVAALLAETDFEALASRLAIEPDGRPPRGREAPQVARQIARGFAVFGRDF